MDNVIINNTRNQNWMSLRGSFSDYIDVLILSEAEKDSDLNWYGFMISIIYNAGVTRNQLSG